MIWNVNPIFLKIDFSLVHLQIRWYGLFFACAFVCGYAILRFIFLKEQKSEEDMDPLLWYMVTGVVIGARFGHCFFYEPYFYLTHPLEILAVWHGGLASHGGAIGAMVALYFYSKNRVDQSYLWILDRVSLAVPLGGFFVRLGNFFNSEIIGRKTDVPWAVYFVRVDNSPRHPAQLYESFAYLICFCIVIAFYWRISNSVDDDISSEKKMSVNGVYFGAVLAMVFGTRFFIEFVKEPQVAFEASLPLDMGQLLSVPFVLVGIVFVARAVVFGVKRRMVVLS